MRYVCNDCGMIFDEEDADTEEFDVEEDCGVGGLFSDHHYEECLVCPDCGSYDLEEAEDEDGEDD